MGGCAPPAGPAPGGGEPDADATPGGGVPPGVAVSDADKGYLRPLRCIFRCRTARSVAIMTISLLG